MSVTAVKQFATKESVIDAIQWTGSEVSYNHIKYWLGSNVKRKGDTLLYQPEKTMEPVEVGNYIVNVNGQLFSMTPQEIREDYVSVKA